MRRTLLVAAVVAVSACGDPPPLRIGIVFRDGEAAAQLAASQINASGGIHGRPLVLRVMDDGGAIGRSAVIVAESLAQDAHILAVVGHSNSTASLAASQIYNARRIVQIAPTSSSPAMANAGPYTFRLVASDVYQARFIARHIAAADSAPRVAAIYVNDDYGQALFRSLQTELNSRRIPLVLEATYAVADPFAAPEGMAKMVAGTDPTHLVWLGRAPQLRQVLLPLRSMLPRIQVLASDGIDAPELAANNGGVFNGVRYVCFVDMHSARPALAALRETYRKRNGTAMTATAALTYDAVMLVAEAARETQPRREEIFRYLSALGRDRGPFEGATGPLTFDSAGQSRPGYCLSEVTSAGMRTAEQYKVIEP